MVHRSGHLLIAVLAGSLLLPATLRAVQPGVNDQAGFFSKAAVTQADQKVQDIYRRYKIPVMIETFPAVPENLQAQYEAAKTDKEKRLAFFHRWAINRATDEGLKGIYVLICRNPGYLQIEPDEMAINAGFTRHDSDALVAGAPKIYGSAAIRLGPLENSEHHRFDTDGQFCPSPARRRSTSTPCARRACAAIGRPVRLDLPGSGGPPGRLADYGTDPRFSRWRRRLRRRARRWSRYARGRLWAGWRLRTGLRRWRRWRWFLQFAAGRHIRRRGWQLDVRLVLPRRPQLILGRHHVAGWL